ncbi:unnamed protein product, partial [Ixodes hexagonus]
LVYPRLLEERSRGGEKVLHVRDGLTLTLEKSTVLAETFRALTGRRPRRERHSMNGRELERNLYHDSKRMAAVTVEEKNGTVEVRGILNDNLRIEPLPFLSRSEDGGIAHKIFEIETITNVPHISKILHQCTFISDPSGEPAVVPDEFTVELIIVSDHHHNSNFSTNESLILYLATAMVSVNIKYECLTDPKMQFSLIGVIASKVIVVSECEDRVCLHAEDTLNNFSAYYVDPNSNDSDTDVYLLVTSFSWAQYDAGVNFYTNFNTCTCIGYFAAICSTMPVALVEDVPGMYNMVWLTAHELGHV